MTMTSSRPHHEKQVNYNLYRCSPSYSLTSSLPAIVVKFLVIVFEADFLCWLIGDVWPVFYRLPASLPAISGQFSYDELPHKSLRPRDFLRHTVTGPFSVLYEVLYHAPTELALPIQ